MLETKKRLVSEGRLDRRRLRERRPQEGGTGPEAANDLLRAKAEAAARRDAQRERERARQKNEIEQLKRDKLELDRRTEEHRGECR